MLPDSKWSVDNFNRVKPYNQILPIVNIFGKTYSFIINKFKEMFMSDRQLLNKAENYLMEKYSVVYRDFGLPVTVNYYTISEIMADFYKEINKTKDKDDERR